MNHLQKKRLSFFLCIVMGLSFFPFTAAYAEEAESIEGEAISVSDGYEVSIGAFGEETIVDIGTEQEKSHEHSYSAAVTDPTCTEQGFTTYTCACGDSYADDYTDALNHPQIIDILEVPPTETAPGTTAGKKCAVCGEILEGCEEIPLPEETEIVIEEQTVTDSSVAEEEYAFVIEGTETEESLSATSRSTVAHSDTWGDLEWTLDDAGTLIISGTGEIEDFNSDSTEAWKAYKDTIVTVSINSGITLIGTYAFSDCSCLASITIPDSVMGISKMAFHGCNSLKSISIPDSIINICDYSFDNCEKLNDIYYGGTQGQWNQIDIGTNNDELFSATIHFESTHVTIVDSGLWGDLNWSLDNNGTLTISGTGEMNNFSLWSSEAWRQYASNIKKIILHSSLTSIGQYAFCDCVNLSTISIPAGITSIGSSAFYRCDNLKTAGPIGSGCNIEFGWSTEIPANAFDRCDPLINIMIPNSVTSIGDRAFASCDSLTSITIPFGVTSINPETFYKCYSIKSITIPESVTDIGDSAFSGCSSLEDVYFGGTQAEWRIITIGQGNEDLTNATLHYIDTGIVSTVTFDMKGYGTDKTPNPKTVEDGRTINDPFPTTDDKKIDGVYLYKWYTKFDLSAASEFRFTTPITEDLTLYARWGCLLEYVTEHGTVTNPKRFIEIGQKANTGVKPSAVAGYEFAGWCTDEACNNAFDFNTPITTNIRLYAKWIPNFKIIKGNGGTAHHGSNYAFTLGYTYSDYSLSNESFKVFITKEGSEFGDAINHEHYFVKWDEDDRVVVYLQVSYINTCDETTYNIRFDTGLEDFGYIEGSFMVSKDPKPSYTVAFEMNNHGTQIPAQQIESGEKATKPVPNPTQDGFAFYDWYADQKCTTVFDFDREITENTIIYARWRCIVTYDATPGTVTISGRTSSAMKVYRDENEKAIYHEPNALAGYVFDMWCIDEAREIPFDFNTPIARNTTLYAKWIPGFSIIEGDGGTAHYGNDYAFTLNYSYSDYEINSDLFKVFVAKEGSEFGNALSQENYVITSDSDGLVVMALKAAYINTCEDAETYKIRFDTGLEDPGFTDGMFNINTDLTTTWNVIFEMKGHGEAPASQRVESGYRATRPTDPTAPGYVF